MTIITNENFADMFISKINENINGKDINDYLKLIVTIYICNDNAIVQLFGFDKSEIFVTAGNLRALTITRLIEKLRELYPLYKVNFAEDKSVFQFINDIGNVSITLNVMPKTIGQNKNEFLAIVNLLKQYYEGEIYNTSFDGQNNIDINAMDKGSLLLLMGKLSTDELRTLISFLPPERISMINRSVSSENDVLGRK